MRAIDVDATVRTVPRQRKWTCPEKLDRFEVEDFASCGPGWLRRGHAPAPHWGARALGRSAPPRGHPSRTSGV